MVSVPWVSGLAFCVAYLLEQKAKGKEAKGKT